MTCSGVGHRPGMTTPATARISSDPSGRPLVRLRGPADVVQAIPYLIGFRPVDSVVTVALGGPTRQLVMTARVDIDDATVDALSVAWASAARNGASAVLIVIHDDAATAGALPHADLASDLRAAAGSAGLDVLDMLCVGVDRFWSYQCNRPACCPPQGRPVERDGVVAAELVLQGMPLRERREDLEAEVAWDAERAARVATQVASLPPPAGSLQARRAAGVALLDQLVRSATIPLDDATAAAALDALMDVAVRDTQLHRRSDPEAERAARLWGDLGRGAPHGFRAAPLTLLAIAAYCRGEGARANVALEAAVADRPEYSMARLLGSAIAGALPPQGIVDAMDEAARDTRRGIESALRPGRRRPRGGR